MVTSSTFSSCSPFLPCTKHLLNGWFSIQRVRSSLYATSGKKYGSRHSVYMSDTLRNP